MPFKAILHAVLALDRNDLRRIVTLGVAKLSHDEVRQWHRVLLGTLAEGESSGGPGG
jgi:hypothetical protein